MVSRDYAVAYNAVGASGANEGALAVRCAVGPYRESQASDANLGRPCGSIINGSVS